MVRTFFNISAIVFIASVVVATDTPKPAATSTAPHAQFGMMFFDLGGNAYDCCGFGDEDCTCKCKCRPPEVTVHVIQPPPTYIYDVTQTARYYEHCDCCGRRFVCGPTCIPQGEVLAPANTGRNVAIAPASQGSAKGGHAKKRSSHDDN